MAQITLNSTGVASSGTLALQSNGTTTAATIDASQNLLVNTTNAGVGGLSVSNAKNINFSESATSAYATLFRQNSSASLCLNYGYQIGAGVNSWASSFATTARSSIAVGAGVIRFYTDASSTVAVGTDITPTERMRIDTTGVNVKGIVNFEAISGSSNGWNVYTYTDNSLRFNYNGAGADEVTIDSSGRLLVGTSTSVIGKMTVSGGIDSINFAQFNIYSTSSSADFEWVLRTGARQLYYVNNASVVASLSLTGVWTNASDARYKENITNSQYGLATVMALKPRAYNLIDQADKPQVGFIAQEVLDVVPEVVDSVHNSVTDEDRYTLSYGNLVAVLTKAIQEQQAIITSLTDRITALEQA